jgi:tetratricopeptide (TPR) repeat protein/SAM-dependent methyltransferase
MSRDMNRDQRRGARPPESPFAAAPGTIAVQFNAAVALHQRGALAEAERRYRTILAQSPRHADSLHNLGVIVLNAGNAAAAAELLEKAIAADNRKAEYHYNIALAYHALGRVEQAAPHLERAIGLRGDYALAHLNLGNIRREQGRVEEAMACYERALKLTPNLPEARFNLANMLADQKRFDAAIANYRTVLTLAPNYAEAHLRLGAAILAQGQPREAIPHIEHSLTLKPDLTGAHEELATAHMSAGAVQSAVVAAARALQLNETETAKTLFAQCVAAGNFTTDPGGRFQDLVRRAVAEAWAAPREFSAVCISLIKLDGRISEWIARANAAWPERLPVREILEGPLLPALAENKLLRTVLACDPIADIGIERLIANVRHGLLCSLTAKDARAAEPEPGQLDFYCAIARQCFVNQYVFSMTEAEIAQAKSLRDSVEQALASGAAISPFAVAVIGAYFPLHGIANAERLRERDWPPAVRELLTQQIEEPAEELKIKSAFPALTAIEDEVSRIVREQYEEDPYPRWIKGGPPAQPAILDRRPAPISDVLIAGCGTGFFTLGFARKAPQARFLAVDLSLSSLAYAKRMANALGVTNIEFAQADIMKLGALDHSFDFIDSSGVLHHMAEPWAGWRTLLSLLRPDGIMQIGLYSELARRSVVAARALIAERGFKPLPDDIRRLREIIAAAKDDSLLKSISQWGDFFTISECRDLLFHPQEHRTTLPEIKKFLADNDLRFAGFILDAMTSDRFARRYPELASLTGKARFEAFADLDRWHDFESEYPDTFASMYRFWVHKPGARS